MCGSQRGPTRWLIHGPLPCAALCRGAKKLCRAARLCRGQAGLCRAAGFFAVRRRTAKVFFIFFILIINNIHFYFYIILNLFFSICVLVNNVRIMLSVSKKFSMHFKYLS
jgi:hypothetical protein